MENCTKSNEQVIKKINEHCRGIGGNELSRVSERYRGERQSGYECAEQHQHNGEVSRFWTPLGGSVDSRISCSFRTPVAPGVAVSACGSLEMF